MIELLLFVLGVVSGGLIVWLIFQYAYDLGLIKHRDQ